MMENDLELMNQLSDISIYQVKFRHVLKFFEIVEKYNTTEFLTRVGKGNRFWIPLPFPYLQNHYPYPYPYPVRIPLKYPGTSIFLILKLNL